MLCGRSQHADTHLLPQTGITDLRPCMQLYQYIGKETEALKNQRVHLTPEYMFSVTNYSRIQSR